MFTCTHANSQITGTPHQTIGFFIWNPGNLKIDDVKPQRWSGHVIQSFAPSAQRKAFFVHHSSTLCATRPTLERQPPALARYSSLRVAGLISEEKNVQKTSFSSPAPLGGKGGQKLQKGCDLSSSVGMYFFNGFYFF